MPDMNEWNYVTVAEHISKYNRNYFRYPGKVTRTVNNRSYIDIVDQILEYNRKYFKFPGENTRNLELEHIENCMNLYYDNYR
jgi:hypothetical protein